MTQQLMIKAKTAAWYLTQSVNQLLYSTVFNNAVWAATNATLVSGETDPVAGTDAFSVTASAANATLLQTVVLSNGTINRTFSVYLKRKTGTGDISITVDGITYVVKTTTGAWARFDTGLSIGGTITCGLKIATSADAVYVAFAQLEDGSAATTYSAVTASPYTVTQIVDGDYPSNTARGCVFLDGRFFVMSLAGEIYQSALEDASSWSALEFIQSQIDPSDGVFLTKSGNYVVAIKEWSTEFFYDAANATGSILSPVQNAAVQIGGAAEGSVQDLGGSIIFMAQTRNGFGRSVMTISGQSLSKISTSSVEKILDRDDLATVYSWSAQVGSHALYGVTLVTSGVTLVYDFSTQHWSFFTYLTTSGGALTVTAVTALGVVTVATHGLSDGDIVKIASVNSDFNGWHVVTTVTTNTFQIQATGTVFSGSGTAQKYIETYFPVVASVRANGRQYMQDKSSGNLYEFTPEVTVDYVGAIAARLRTPKLDDGTTNYKTMGKAEVIGDKISSTAVLRWTDDDYATYASFRPVDLSAPRSQIRRVGNYRRRAFELLHVKDALLRVTELEVE